LKDGNRFVGASQVKGLGQHLDHSAVVFHLNAQLLPAPLGQRGSGDLPDLLDEGVPEPVGVLSASQPRVADRVFFKNHRFVIPAKSLSSRRQRRVSRIRACIWAPACAGATVREVGREFWF
jgi:hypothetical protein